MQSQSTPASREAHHTETAIATVYVVNLYVLTHSGMWSHTATIAGSVDREEAEYQAHIAQKTLDNLDTIHQHRIWVEEE